MSTTILIDKDPSLKTLLMQEALSARGLYTGALDNWAGSGTTGAYEKFLASFADSPTIALAATRKISADGLELVKAFEGLYLKAYQDEAGIWTIGWGHTGLQHNDGTVYRGRVITAEEASALLAYDMHQFEQRVSALVKVGLRDDEFAALVSFDFNTGGLTLDDGSPSTLLRLLNANDRKGAADQFLRWNKVDGRVVRGLTRRRQSERNLFLSIRPFIVPA